MTDRLNQTLVDAIAKYRAQTKKSPDLIIMNIDDVLEAFPLFDKSGRMFFNSVEVVATSKAARGYFYVCDKKNINEDLSNQFCNQQV